VYSYFAYSFAPRSVVTKLVRSTSARAVEWFGGVVIDREAKFLLEMDCCQWRAKAGMEGIMYYVGV